MGDVSKQDNISFRKNTCSFIVMLYSQVIYQCMLGDISCQLSRMPFVGNTNNSTTLLKAEFHFLLAYSEHSAKAITLLSSCHKK